MLIDFGVDSTVYLFGGEIIGDFLGEEGFLHSHLIYQILNLYLITKFIPSVFKPRPINLNLLSVVIINLICCHISLFIRFLLNFSHYFILFIIFLLVSDITINSYVQSRALHSEIYK